MMGREWIAALDAVWRQVSTEELPGGLKAYYLLAAGGGPVWVCEPIPGVTLVMFAEYFEGVLHSYVDLWRAGLLEASSDDPDSWVTLERFMPRQEWPDSAFAWVESDDPRLPLRVGVERYFRKQPVAAIGAVGSE